MDNTCDIKKEFLYNRAHIPMTNDETRAVMLMPSPFSDFLKYIDSGNPSRSNNTVLQVSVQDLNDNFPKFYQVGFEPDVLKLWGFFPTNRLI